MVRLTKANRMALLHEGFVGRTGGICWFGFGPFRWETQPLDFWANPTGGVGVFCLVHECYPRV